MCLCRGMYICIKLQRFMAWTIQSTKEVLKSDYWNRINIIITKLQAQMLENKDSNHHHFLCFYSLFFFCVN